MAGVEMRWSAYPEGDKDRFGPLVADMISLMPPWADIADNGPAAVERAITDYIGEAEWEEWFGNDATLELIEVDVHGPPAIAGPYTVDLARVVKATAKRIETAA